MTRRLIVEADGGSRGNPGVAGYGALVRDGETREVLSAHSTAPEVVVGGLDATDPLWADIVVSTIPAHAQTDALLARCAPVPIVFEALYEPWPTPLAASAEGRVLVGGLDLLVHQAAIQFELFTGVVAPLEAMRAAGEDALARRGR